MRHRERGEVPTRSGEYWAWSDGMQSVTGLALGADGSGEVTAGEQDGLAAADDLDCAAELVELASGEEARQPRHMVEVKVGQQHVLQPAKPESGAHQLALGALAAIDEEASRPAANEQRRRAPLGGGHCCGGAEKDDFKHAALPKRGSAPKWDRFLVWSHILKVYEKEHHSGSRPHRSSGEGPREVFQNAFRGRESGDWC